MLVDTDKQWTIYLRKIEQFIARIEKRILVDAAPLAAVYARTADPVPFEQRHRLDYRPIAAGASWGDTWDSAWFHITGRIPPEWQGRHGGHPGRSSK